MNCREIDRILDEHARTQLSAARRAEFDAHLAACAQCRVASATQALLEAEQPEGPRPGLFESATRRAVSRSSRPAPHCQGPRWQTLGGLGMVAALVVVMVLALSNIGRNDTVSATVGTRVAAESAVSERSRFVEGEHFARLAAQPATANAADSAVAVIEFFMYPCNHCYEFEFRFDAWLSQQSASRVMVTRVPVQWSPAAKLYARAFYAAGLLGVTDQIHRALFEAIHENGEALASEDALRNFFARFGIDAAAFDAAFHAAAIDAELERASQLAARFGIDATPSIVVGDSYLATPETAGSHDALVDLIDWLVERVAEVCMPARRDFASRPSRCPVERVP